MLYLIKVNQCQSNNVTKTKVMQVKFNTKPSLTLCAKKFDRGACTFTNDHLIINAFLS